MRFFYKGNTMKNQNNRATGILLHISSLPNKYGIGTFGKSAYEFVDLLSDCRISYWQVLPLVQTSYGDSPYQSAYSGSGNPYFIDLEFLVEEGLLKKSELSACRNTKSKIDYAFLYQNKYAVLRRAFGRFDVSSEDFVAFVKSERFDGYALFMAIKEKFGGVSFDQWPNEFKFAKKRSLEKFRRENEQEYLFWQFLQYEFSKQWKALKSYANQKGVFIIGDIPLYVAYDSADVWLNPKLFKLNADRGLKKVAGVPPDYFSATGQLWGNPVYNWSVHKKDGYSWWTERFRQAFELYDVVRVDHFRGFDRYYEIDEGEETAIKGKWKQGPKYELFQTVENKLGKMNIIAEDLGALDKGVYRLMDETGYPGMKVLEFAFDGNKNNPYLPKNIKENSVCYTGTHDNDTLLGYINKLKGRELRNFKNSLEEVLKDADIAYPLQNKKEMAQAILYLTMKSKAFLAVLPIQDILLLDSRARMNIPSTTSGNGRFKLKHIPNEQDMSDFCRTLKFYERNKDYLNRSE